MKITASWDIAPSSLIEVHWRFGGAYYLYHQGNGGSTHLTNVGLLQRDYKAEGFNFHTNCRENLKSHSLNYAPQN
jgi:hypothetical protein